MFNSIRDFDEAFIKLFNGVSVPVKGENIPIFYRYYKKSSENYVEEEDEQIYPCIVLQDYTPKQREDWFIDEQEVEGAVAEDNLTMELHRRPMGLTFTYDVSICSKSYNTNKALQNYFTKEYMNRDSVILKAIDLGVAGIVGDVIPMKVKATDIPRRDGVYEINYNFTLDAWVHISEPREIDLVKNIIINIKPTK